MAMKNFRLCLLDGTTRVAMLLLILCGNRALPPLSGTPVCAASEPAPPSEAEFWWYRFPTFGATQDAATIRRTHLRLAMQNLSADPTWGPFGQAAHSLDRIPPAARKAFLETKQQGVRWITWVEAFGDCVMYAAALQQNPDGTFEQRQGDSEMARLVRTAWNWESSSARAGNAYRWVGLHNTANNEDFVQPHFSREATKFPIPTYPDGREALGWLPEGTYPTNARIYDACGARDINGHLDLSGEGFRVPEKANTRDATTGEPLGSQTGLYPLVVGPNSQSRFKDRQSGDIVHVSHMAASKDPACPFWPKYARVSVRQVLANGLDGLWCDNFACYNNFGMPPLRNAFGAWSEHRFRKFLAQHFTEQQRSQLGIADTSTFQIRDYLIQKATTWGAVNPSSYGDRAWFDRRWLDEPIWNAYKVFKQQISQEALRNFYHAIKDEAERAGRPDFCVAGNDVPVYALGWTRDAWLDMVSSEQTPGWWVTTGSRGIMIPPLGKYAVIYRAALEHQKGPYATVWYSLGKPYESLSDSTELGKVLAAEAFANSTFLKYVPRGHYAGTEESHAWWNQFAVNHEDDFGRRQAVADIGLLYSPDNQLAGVVPGGHTIRQDDQPHSFSHWGFATAMVDAHIPYRVVTDWSLTAESLQDLQTFIIPNAECLDSAAQPVLDAWVRSGGRLIITGPSGCRAGPAGMFERRTQSLLQPLVEREMASATGDVVTRRHGAGTVIWSPDTVGVHYYVKHEERSRRLDGMVKLIGGSRLVDAPQVPSTVGIFLWRTTHGGELFADLVNYDFDADSDHVQEATNIQFKLRLPPDSRLLNTIALSPDQDIKLSCQDQDGWAVISIPRLQYFVSVKIKLLLGTGDAALE
jgi:hypothetical protein